MVKTSKLLKIIGAACLSVGAISICMAAIAHGVSREKSETEASVGTYSTNVSSYYATSGTATGQTLLGQLHDLTCTNHETYTSYDDCKNPTYIYAMEPGSTSSYIMEFYSQKDISKTWDGNTAGTWNREHVWPQSLSNSLWSESGGGADLQHLRPAEVRINGTRGNHLYAELTDFGISKNSSYDETSTYKYASNYYAYRKKRQNNSDVNDCVAGYVYTGSDVFEPFDNIKGDVARIVMYMYMHYNSYSYVGGTKDGSTSSYFGNLPITKVIKTSTNTAAAAWALLLKWSANDPVSSAEQNRNNVAASYQGNRNPFIDYPDLAECIWGTTTKTWSWSTRSISGSSTTSSVDFVSVSPSALSLSTSGSNTTGQLTATVSVSGGAAQTVNWSSSNTSVATVSNTGLVTAVAAGSATITATSTVDSTKKDTCAVTVTSGESGGGSSSGTITIAVSDIPTAYSGTSFTTADGGIGFGCSNINNSSTAGSMQFKSGQGYLYNTAAIQNITNISIATSASGTFSGTIYTGSSSHPTSGTSYSITNGNSVSITDSPSYFTLLAGSVSGGAKCGNITITYGGSSQTKTLSSISLNTDNVTKSFTVGDTFTYSGLVVTANYSDSTSATVTPNSVSTPDMTTTGNKTVTVSYTEGGVTKTANYSITVNEASSGGSSSTYTANGGYVKITSTSDLTDGDYLIVYENGNKAFDGSSTNLDTTSNTIGVTISDSVITESSSVNASAFTYNSSAKTLKSKSGYYIGATSNSNTLNVSTTVAYTNTISFTSGNANIVGSGGAYLRYNAANDQQRFKYFKSSSYTGQQAIQLYKKTISWGSTFLSTVTCNGGSTAPSTANWSTMQTAYTSMTTAEQNKVKAATANQSGTDLQKAIARYVFIVNKYTNRTNYPDYLSKASSSNRINLISMNDSTTLLVVIATATCLIGMTFIALSIKKRKEK